MWLLVGIPTNEFDLIYTCLYVIRMQNNYFFFFFFFFWGGGGGALQFNSMAKKIIVTSQIVFVFLR